MLGIVAICMLVSAARADSGYSQHTRYERNESKPLSISEFFCAVAGGTAAGVIMKSAGANDPFTFLGVLVGGLIGADFCKWVRDDVNIGAQSAAFRAGLDSPVCSQKSWQSRHYKGNLNIISESWKTGSHYDAGTDNICKQFETTIFEHSGKFVGRTQAWACKNNVGNWIVTHENWINKQNVKTCGSSRIDSGAYTGQSRVEAPTEINTRHIRGVWSLERFRRHVNDLGTERVLKLARRTEFPGEVEVGILKALSDDGRGVIIYFSPERQVVVGIDDVAIECRATDLCYNSEVTTKDGMAGKLQYVFRNGDVVINDLKRGIKMRPASYLN